LHQRYELYAEFEPGNSIQFTHNSCASKWADISTLVQSQDVEAQAEGVPACEEFLEDLKKTIGGTKKLYMLIKPLSKPI